MPVTIRRIGTIFPPTWDSAPFFQKSLDPFYQMVWVFPFRLWLPSNLVRERTIVLIVYEVSLPLPEAGTA